MLVAGADLRLTGLKRFRATPAWHHLSLAQIFPASAHQPAHSPASVRASFTRFSQWPALRSCVDALPMQPAHWELPVHCRYRAGLSRLSFRLTPERGNLSHNGRNINQACTFSRLA